MLTHVHAADNVAVIGAIDPDVLTATTHDSDWVDVSKFHTILVVAMAGTLGSSATFDVDVRQATDSSGTSAKAISGASATQLTQAGTDESDSQVVLSIQSDALDVDNDFQYLGVRITVGTASSDGGCVILGVGPRVGPASDNDSADVAEVIRV